MVKIVFDNNIPIYSQIVDRFVIDICSGTLPPGSRITPVRELAMQLGVNPNTLQRALGELESMGLLFTERTAGRFVTEDAALIDARRREMSRSVVSEFMEKMRALGWNDEETVKLITVRRGENE